MLRKVESAGYLSADTVAHCGGDMGEDFVWSLTLVDENTLWLLNRVIWNKGQRATCNALGHLLRELPFRVREINTDNDSEFINYHLNTYLKEHYKTCKQTRSRPYKRNDNTRVERRRKRMMVFHKSVDARTLKKERDKALTPFIGRGSTLVAAQQLSSSMRTTPRANPSEKFGA